MSPSTSRPPSAPYAGQTIHFIGVGGCGMSGLAEFVLTEGGEVSGSDLKASAATDRLADLGATIHIGHSEANVPPRTDLVAHSAAVKADNRELVEAMRLFDISNAEYEKAMSALYATPIHTSTSTEDSENAVLG